MCVIKCKEGGTWNRVSKRFVKSENQIVAKCGRKGFAPKVIIAKCDGVQRMAENAFDDIEIAELSDFGPVNAATPCYNNVYDKYNTSSDIVHVHCKGT